MEKNLKKVVIKSNKLLKYNERLEVAKLYTFYCIKLKHDADYMQMNIRIEIFQIRNYNELRFIC